MTRKMNILLSVILILCAVGQQVEIVKRFNGWIRYPFLGLRMFCGVVGGGILMFLSFMWWSGSKP